MNYAAIPIPAAFLFLGLTAATPALPAELAVRVTGIEKAEGEIGCALYSAGDEFLTPSENVPGKWIAAKADGVECRFTDLKPGAYAVAVVHDFNGNKTNDTNFLGIPTEPWGVSNNARPMFRAPTFDEAKIAVGDGAPVEISVTLETTIP